MHRFFVSPSNVEGGKIRLLGDDVKHITRVLRLGQGDEISICDGEGTDYVCTIAEAQKDFVLADVKEKKASKSESNIQITLYQGLPKSDKMEYIIQKCVELGVHKVVPVVTKRTVVKVKDNSSKDTRWKRIAEEAAKQSGRGVVPVVESVISFSQMLEEMNDSSLFIIAYENENKTKLKDILRDNKEKKKISIIVGPEGGFDALEVEEAKRRGAHSVTLGPRILRCETAPVALASAVMYELGDW